MNQPHEAADGRWHQILFEHDFLVTEGNEWYFVIAIFGVEFAINLGGPEIEGYENWLHKNGHRSPLYPNGLGSIPPL